jgi:hypothetical protein
MGCPVPCGTQARGAHLQKGDACHGVHGMRGGPGGTRDLWSRVPVRTRVIDGDGDSDAGVPPLGGTLVSRHVRRHLGSPPFGGGEAIFPSTLPPLRANGGGTGHLQREGVSCALRHAGAMHAMVCMA